MTSRLRRRLLPLLWAAVFFCFRPLTGDLLSAYTALFAVGLLEEGLTYRQEKRDALARDVMES